MERPTRVIDVTIESLYGKDTRISYIKNLNLGQRCGQALMNALPPEQYAALSGTKYDPFHSDDMTDVWAAIDFLVYSK